MGSRSDWETLEPARETLDELQIPCEMRVVSAHRMPDEMFAYAQSARSRGLHAIIAGAGGAAHLPGMVAAKTLVPVIGVPIASKALSGIDSLLSIVQMPAGVPVATMAINGAVNAALLAARIVALHDDTVAACARGLRAAYARCRGVEHSVIRTIGVIGGGQLGRMFTLEAKRMGFDVVVLDPQEHSPAGQVADEQIVANYDDMEAIDQLGQRTDVVTYEFENIAIASVEYLEQHGYRVTPSSDVLRITQDRLLEKRFVRSCGIATADFAEINRLDDLAEAGMSIGFPAILKTVRGGYDGKGQWRVTSLDEARAAFSAAKGAKLIYERVVPFVRELSIVATRDANDKIVCYPVGENTHDRGILTMTVAPARVSDNCALTCAHDRDDDRQEARHRRDVLRGALFDRQTAKCWSTRSRRARTTAGTTRST